MVQENNRREFANTKELSESEQPSGTDFNQNFRPYIVLKLPHDSDTMLVSHWSRFTPTYCLFFTCHSLYPRRTCFTLAMVYTHVKLVLHWSQLTPTRHLFSVNPFVNFIYGRMYQSTTSQVKAIYYIKLWDLSLIIRWFNVISKTLVEWEEVLPFQRGSVGVFYRPKQLG